MTSTANLSGSALMDAIRDKRMEDLNVVEWDELRTTLGDDDDVDAVAIEFVVMFYNEGLGRIKKILEAALLFRRGVPRHQFADDLDLPVENVVKDQAHSLKGTSANLRMFRIAKVAERVELPLKDVIAPPLGSGTGDPDAIKAVMNVQCAYPCKDIKILVDEYRRLTSYLQHDVRRVVRDVADVEAQLEPDVLASWQQITEARFDEEVVLPLREFWSGSATPRGQSETNIPGTTMGGGMSMVTTTSAPSPRTAAPSPATSGTITQTGVSVAGARSSGSSRTAGGISEPATWATPAPMDHPVGVKGAAVPAISFGALSTSNKRPPPAGSTSPGSSNAAGKYAPAAMAPKPAPEAAAAAAPPPAAPVPAPAIVQPPGEES